MRCKKALLNSKKPCILTRGHEGYHVDEKGNSSHNTLYSPEARYTQEVLSSELDVITIAKRAVVRLYNRDVDRDYVVNSEDYISEDDVIINDFHSQDNLMWRCSLTVKDLTSTCIFTVSYLESDKTVSAVYYKHHDAEYTSLV